MPPPQKEQKKQIVPHFNALLGRLLVIVSENNIAAPVFFVSYDKPRRSSTSISPQVEIDCMYETGPYKTP